MSDRSRKYHRRKAKIAAENEPRRRHRPRRRTILDAKGASRPIKDASPSRMSTSGSDSPQSRQRNATETQEPPSSAEGGSWSENDVRELQKAVPVYKAKYAAIYAAIQSGAIPMDKKDRSQQTLRSFLISMKVKMLKYDERLPPGFDLIRSNDKKIARYVSDKGKNPWRKEADVDASGQPTNTQWDPDQDPALEYDPGRQQVMVAQEGNPRATGTNVGSCENRVRDLSGQGGHRVQPSPVRPSLGGQEDTARQQDPPAQQGQEASMQGFRRMVPSKTVKPGRAGRNIQHKPQQ